MLCYNNMRYGAKMEIIKYIILSTFIIFFLILIDTNSYLFVLGITLGLIIFTPKYFLSEKFFSLFVGLFLLSGNLFLVGDLIYPNMLTLSQKHYIFPFFYISHSSYIAYQFIVFPAFLIMSIISILGIIDIKELNKKDKILNFMKNFLSKIIATIIFLYLIPSLFYVILTIPLQKINTIKIEGQVTQYYKDLKYGNYLYVNTKFGHIKIYHPKEEYSKGDKYIKCWSNKSIGVLFDERSCEDLEYIEENTFIHLPYDILKNKLKIYSSILLDTMY